MKKVFLYLAVGLICMVCMTSCEDDATQEENVALTGITVDPGSLTLMANSSRQIIATPVPINATGVLFEWSSDDPDAVTVAQDGTVFVKKYKDAATTVTVKSGSIETTISVSAQEVPLTGITLDFDSVNMLVGKTQKITAKPFPANATDEVAFTWSSSNPEVATVDNEGLVTLLSHESAIVTVTCGSISKTVKVSGYVVTDIVTATELEVTHGTSQQLEASPKPEFLTGQVSFTWHSEDPTIAEVDENGLVTGVSIGTTNITVSSGSIVKSIQVTVTPGKFPKEGLSVVAWSDAYTGSGNDAGGVAALFDNRYGSPNWHSGRGSNYNASSFPYWFVVDMGSPKTVTKIVTQFQNAGRTAKMRCYISNSNSIATQGTGNSAIPNPEACEAWGTKISDTEEWNDAIGTVNMLSNATAGRYLLLYLYEPGPNDGDHHTNIFEIDVYGY